jgi:hypothetical protein
MPRLSCWFIRASLLYLAIGFTLGALMLSNKGLGFYPPAWNVLPVHMEMLLVGWFVQLAMGVVFWILPRFREGPPRGNESLAWLAFGLVNLGIGWVVAQAVFSLQGLALVGRVMEIGGVGVFVAGSWRRVRAS